MVNVQQIEESHIKVSRSHAFSCCLHGRASLPLGTLAMKAASQHVLRGSGHFIFADK